MTRSTGKRKFHFKNVLPKDPAIKPMGAWPAANQAFYKNFRYWLTQGGYSPSSLNIYGVAVRLALGYLNRPYWQITPENLAQVQIYIAGRFESAATQQEYRKGLAKLEQYLLKQTVPKTAQDVNWPYYLDTLPAWLAEKVRSYLDFRRKSWPPERQYRTTLEMRSHLTGCLRWMAAHATLSGLPDLTPNLWFDYQEERLTAGRSPVTLNNELRRLQAFVQYFSAAGEPVCARLLLVDEINEGDHIPRDVPAELLRKLLAEIEADAQSPDPHLARLGIMDKAWCLLMLHCGLRTGEVRRLKPEDIDWSGRKLRIEQSKGLKDRFVFLSPQAAEALQAYLAVRGPSETPNRPGKHVDYVFTYRHRPLGSVYCRNRIHTYGERCGVSISPHRLRHSCASLLLNAGAPVLAVQAILGHRRIDTTLNYARLYDGTIAADYHRAMRQVESQLVLEPTGLVSPHPAELLALVDRLAGRVEAEQAEMLQALRLGLAALVKNETSEAPLK